jgi:ABC-type cobalamin/Fe3+-siderophores transport system ATPase subunit
MRIRSLTMKNFRGFEDATIDLDRPLTVLFGANGSGKSSVLMGCVNLLSHALAHAYASRPPPEEEALWNYYPDDTDVRRGADKLFLEANLSNGAITQKVTVSRPDPRNMSIRDAGLILLHGAGPWLSVFYQASREVAAAADAFAPERDGNGEVIERPSSASHGSLVAGRLKFRSFFQWFKAREDVENELKVSKQDLSLEDPQLAAVRRAVARMLPGFSGLRIQRDPLHMVIRKGETTLAVDQLSDGEKALIVLTADLARRLAITYASKGDDPLEGEGVVLIDEIEQHLHPAWQRSVVKSLRHAFPNCQLILTTHSPQVLSEVPNDAVVLVQDFQFFHPAAPTEGRDSNAILREVMGVDARPHQVVEEIGAVSGLLDEGKNDEARARLDRLAQALTERDPDVARLRGLLDVVERIDAGDHQGT